jgi:STE24 endopeptidase
MPVESALAPSLVAAVLLVGLVLAGSAVTPRVPAGLRPALGSTGSPGDFTDQERARGASLRRSLRPYAYLRLVLGLLLAAVLGLTPSGAAVVGAVGQPFGSVLLQAALGVLALGLLRAVLDLPAALRVEVLLRRAGLSVQTWRGWVVDRLKAAALGVVVVAVLVPAAYALIRARPGSWWVVGALAAAALTVLLSFVLPVLVEPLFNRFAPLPDGPLRSELLDLAARDGVAVRDVLVADASRRTTALNAYVSGFGRTRRIVVHDTLLGQAPEPEVRLVVAHELGHAAASDVLRGTLLGALAAALGVVVLGLAATSADLLALADAPAPGDPRSAGLALFVLAAVGAVLGPPGNLLSRRIEIRADLHSLGLTRDPVAFVASERRLAVTNLADLAPPRLAQFLFATHPSVPERIALARRWAEQEGLPVPGPLLAAGAP